MSMHFIAKLPIFSDPDAVLGAFYGKGPDL